MASNIEKMALIGQPAWHGLENVMTRESSKDEWKYNAGLMHTVHKVPVMYQMPSDTPFNYRRSTDKFVLVRSDNGKDISVVSDDYHVVQPTEIIDFFDDVAEQHGFTMETAGCLAGGKRIWAMARTGNEVQIGKLGDIIKQYVILATSYDGSVATTAKHTSQRVVCENTFFLCLGNGEPAIKVNHRSVFDAKQVKIDLGLIEDEWNSFGVMANRMHEAAVPNMTTAARWYAELLTESELTDAQVMELVDQNRVLKGLLSTFRKGRGGEATIWGLFNGTTAFIDHVRGRSADTRMNAAWFGNGATLKQKAWDKATKSVEAMDSAVVA